MNDLEFRRTAMTALATITFLASPVCTLRAETTAPAPGTVLPTLAVEPERPDGIAARRAGSLVVPTTDEARAEKARVPGAISIVGDEAYRADTQATTVKDMLDYVPGVFTQPKWGEDTRLSIRGSGLSRNFHLRGTSLYMDGIPISTADGFGDFQEIDPTAYRHLEVYRGANGARFGATSLGGAVNFVSPTGRDARPFEGRLDAGSFGFRRTQASAAGEAGAFDYFVTGSWQRQDGFRDHSDGISARGSGNLGIRLSDDVETRFYFNANEARQRIPGSVTRDAALNRPEEAAAANVSGDWQRNIDTWRVANRTAVRLGDAALAEFGVFGVKRHLMHPIFQWLDYEYRDHGAFGRFSGEGDILGHRSRVTLGAVYHHGTTDADQYENRGGEKGALLSSSRNVAGNLVLDAEHAFYVLPDLALVAGAQYMHVSRDLEDRFRDDGDQSGRNAYVRWNPRAGLLWEGGEGWQAFANVARSAEAPSFGENSFAASAAFDARMQVATTYEVGARGETPRLRWEATVYHADLQNELQCTFPFGVANFCLVRNAEETMHRGLELGFGGTVGDDMAAAGDALDLDLAYTWSDFRFVDDPQFGDNALPGAPEHFLRAELVYRHPTGIYVGPNVEWAPNAYHVDSANTLETEGYGLWGLKAGYDTGSGLALLVEARNLADTPYIASTGITNRADAADTALFEPGTGRAAWVGVRYLW